MAAPASATPQNLSGKWTLNKKLSSDPADMFELQGIPWLMRKTMSMGTLTLHNTHTPTNLVTSATLSGGIKGETETRVLDFSPQSSKNPVFGNVVETTRALGGMGEVEVEELKEGLDEAAIETVIVNEEKDWKSHQVWGFGVVQGERRHVRKILFTTPKRGNRLVKTLVYDYLGGLDA